MNKLQQKLTKEIERQEAKGVAQHQVAGYRQTDSAAALLASVRGKQKAAITWRQKVIASGADSVRKIKVSNRRVSVLVNVYSKDGIDLLALSPARLGFWQWDSNDTLPVVDFYRANYFNVIDI